MEYIKKSELELIAKGSHSHIYKYLIPYGQYGMNMVVKVTTRPRATIDNLKSLQSIGCNKVYAEICLLEDTEAILMENLYTDEVVYVFPNTYRQNWKDNQPEVYLSTHKLKGIANMQSLLCQVCDLVHSCDSKGIELQIDMLSFGVPKGVEIPEVMYKVVDVDCMMQNEEYIYKLTDYNISEAKWALNVFVQNCVELAVQNDLLEQIDNFKW